jgi:hypothetical protein
MFCQFTALKTVRTVETNVTEYKAFYNTDLYGYMYIIVFKVMVIKLIKWPKEPYHLRTINLIMGYPKITQYHIYVLRGKSPRLVYVLYSLNKKKNIQNK